LHKFINQCESVNDYIQCSHIDTDGMWGANVEMACLAHILQAPMHCFDVSQRRHIWAAYFPADVDRFIPRDIRQKSLYIILPITISLSLLQQQGEYKIFIAL